MPPCFSTSFYKWNVENQKVLRFERRVSRIILVKGARNRLLGPSNSKICAFHRFNCFAGSLFCLYSFWHQKQSQFRNSGWLRKNLNSSRATTCIDVNIFSALHWFLLAFWKASFVFIRYDSFHHILDLDMEPKGWFVSFRLCLVMFWSISCVAGGYRNYNSCD